MEPCVRYSGLARGGRLSSRHSTVEATAAADGLRREVAAASESTLLAELARFIAHEVNQPLAAVVANAAACGRWLERDRPDLAEARAALQRAIHEARRAGEVVRGIQAFLHREAAREERLEVGALFEAAVALSAPRPARLGVWIDLDAPPGLAARGHRLEVLGVLMHLIDNALDAVGERAEDRRIVLGARAAGSEVEFHVSDNGPGIAPPLRERVFEPLYTLRADGHGLGLAAARAVVDAHGGRLWVDPEPPEGGASLRFTLPGAA